MADVLSTFATTVLKEKMESLGYKRIRNGWYRVIPDVVLCVELQKLKYHAFRISYGIVPFSCYLFHNLELANFRIESENWEKNRDKYVAQFDLPVHPEIQVYFWKPDNTSFSLSDPQKYPFYFTFWTDAINEIVLPVLQSIRNMKDACDTIERLWTQRENKYEYYSYAPMFIRLGECEKALDCLAPYIRRWAGEENRDSRYIETAANEAWHAWKKEGTHLESPYLWQWLIQTDDQPRLSELISANETAALTWVNKNKLLR